MQNTWHTPKKIFIAVEVIAKNSRYLDLPAPIVLVYASSRAAAVLRLQKFQHLKLYYGRNCSQPSDCLNPGFSPPAVLLLARLPSPNKKIPGCTGDDQKHMQGEKSFVAHRGANKGKNTKKDPLALRAARGVFEQSLAAAYFPT